MRLYKRYFLGIILIAVLLLFTNSADTYVVNIRHLSVEDGLASREVFCGVQDQQGFIWFGTRSGLNRYDGKNYVLYSESNSALREDRIIHIAEDDRGFMWLMHGDVDRLHAKDTRIDILNTVNGEINAIGNNMKDMPFSEYSVVAFNRNGAGEMIIHLSNGEIYSWTSKSGFVKRQRTWVPDPQSVVQLANGFADLPLTNAYLRDESGDSCLVLPMMNPRADGSVPSLVFNLNTQQFSIADVTQGQKKLPATLNYHSALVPEGNINSVSVLFDEFSNSSIVQVTNSFVAYCKEERYYQLMDALDLSRYPAFTPYAHFNDRSGNIWMCTNTGVFCIRSEQNRFNSYFTSDEVAMSNYEGNQARAIYCDSSGLYANIWDHLMVKHDSSVNKYPLGAIGYPLYKNNSGVWIGGTSFVHFDFGKGTNETVKNEDPQNIAWSVFSLNDTLLLCGMDNGIMTFNTTSKQWNTVDNPAGAPSPHATYRIIRDKSGRLLTASAEGVYELNNDGSIRDYFGPRATGAEHQLFFRDLYDICQDRNGKYWLATNGNGVFCWDGGIDVKHFTIADGLSSNLVYCILEDDNGYLWMSSDYGLMRFDPLTSRVKTFTVKNGLTHNEFNRISAFRSETGELYFGGLNGIIEFNPNDFVTDTARFDAPMRVVSYSQFSADEEKLVDKAELLKTSGKILLNPGDKFFTLEFMLLDFEESQHHYAYKIDGIDADWIYTSENSIRFSDLPYGEFTLHIRGQNAEGEWSVSELEIPVAVLKPYYRENWFMGSSILMGGLLFFGFIRWRTYSLRRDKLKLEAQVEERTEKLSKSLEEKEILLREIHHRVKNNLQIISGLLELQSAGIEDEAARALLADSQNRVQSIALIHHKLYQNENLAAIEFNGFITELFNQVLSVYKADSKDITAEIDIKELFLDIDTAIPAGLIINELLVNSFKYAFRDSATGTIRIELRALVKDQYELRYTDDGPGLPEHLDVSKSKSLGLRLVTRLAKQIGGQTEYIPGENHRFIITFTNKLKTKPQPAYVNN